MSVLEEDLSVAFGLCFRLLFAFVCICIGELHAKQPSPQTREAVTPYLLPSNHPLKSILDEIFSQRRVLLNLKTLEKAGFDKAKPNLFTDLIVTRHPKMPGYVFKLYLDAQRYHKGMLEHEIWLQRIQGAQKVHHFLKLYNLENQFKVPQKWIYAVPEKPRAPKGYDAKHYILIAEDMQIFDKAENEALWKSDYVTEDLLKNLYLILRKIGLSDCAKPDNIPFSADGRIAFIDTQTHGVKRMSYSKLTTFLSKENKSDWKKLTKE